MLVLVNHAERISYLENLKEETLSPTELAKVIGGRPFAYNVAARAGKLELPHVFRGRNLRIFKQPVLDLLRGNSENTA